jgi:glutamate carboxypeptidase
MTTNITDSLPAPLLASSLELLEALTAISSPSGDPQGLARAADLLATAFTARGLAAAVTWEKADGAGDGGKDLDLPVLHVHGGDVSQGHLLLIGHLDTVLPALPPRREGDRLIATGAIDMKGGLVTLIGALDVLAERGVAPPSDLRLVVVPDEEVGGAISRRAMHTWGRGARAVWVLEPGELQDEAETIVAGRRGMFQWRLRVTGQAAHSGLAYWQGRSALAAAALWCAEAEKLSRREGGPTVNCGRLVAGDASFVENLARAAGLVGTERQLNVVPDRAIAEGEARYLRVSEGDEVLRGLQALAAEIATETGTAFELTEFSWIPPMDPAGPQRNWCDRAVAFAASRGWKLEVENERGGISFPNFLPEPGAVPVLDGLGPVGGGMHTRDEFVDLRSFERRILLLADLLEADAAAQTA